MGIEKKILSFRIDEELIEKLRDLAQLQNRTLSNYVETLLKRHVQAMDKNEDDFIDNGEDI